MYFVAYVMLSETSVNIYHILCAFHVLFSLNKKGDKGSAETMTISGGCFQSKASLCKMYSVKLLQLTFSSVMWCPGFSQRC